VAESNGGKWTRADDYVTAMARRRTARRDREPRDRTQPEAPRMFLSTVPFLALIGLLGVLAVAIMVAAFPGGNRTQLKQRQAAPRELGVAPRGWFQEAQKEFHR
jgi:hypothetical protein